MLSEQPQMIRLIGGKYLYDGTSGVVFRAGRSVVEAARQLFDLKIARLPGVDATQLQRAHMIIRGKQAEGKLLNRPIVDYVIPRATEVRSAPTVKITLSVTDRCNLRCTYCPYSRVAPTPRHRIHGHASMSLEMAKRSLRFILDVLDEHTSIAFYGGEPLLNINCLMYVIREIRTSVPTWNGLFTVTTNMTVYSREIGDFLADNQVLLVVSLDGPRDIHDRNRHTGNGQGSFSRVLEHLRDLQQRHSSYFSQYVCTNTTLTSLLSFERIDDFIREIGCAHSTFSPVIGFQPSAYEGVLRSDASTSTSRDLQEWAISKIARAKDPSEIVESPMLLWVCTQYVAQVKKSVATDEHGLRPFKPCIPGTRPLINSDGTISLCVQCEKLKIGNVTDGIDQGKVNQILRDWQELLADDCLSCWASGFCEACYALAWDGSKLQRPLLRTYCESFRGSIEPWLELFLAKEEEQPGFFDFIHNIDQHFVGS